MDDLIEISWTSGSLDEARRISRFLVQDRIVACAQITPWIESVFLWNNRLETTQESKVILKTQRQHFDAIKKIILENTSYQVPEIVYSEIKGGHKEYLDWVIESTKAKNEMA